MHNQQEDKIQVLSILPQTVQISGGNAYLSHYDLQWHFQGAEDWGGWRNGKFAKQSGHFYPIQAIDIHDFETKYSSELTVSDSALVSGVTN